MRSITVGLHVEGASDLAFLTELLPRLVANYTSEPVQTPILALPKWKREKAAIAGLLGEAWAARAIDIACIHHDADSHTRVAAVTGRLEGICRDAAARDGLPPERCVAVIPIRETESWCFADMQAICRALGVRQLPTSLDIRGLACPEDIVDAKQRLNAIWTQMRGHRTTPEFGILASETSLEALSRIPSFQRFEAAFRVACAAALGQ